MCLRNFGYTYGLIFVFFVCANSTPIIIRTGLVKNQGQHQTANVYDAAHKKGIANFEEDAGFNKDNEKKHVASANAGSFVQENGEKKDSVDQNHMNKEQFFQNGGGSIADVGNKISHKKGHHKSGFQNHYHKDEQGSNSSFFDDGADEGDQYVYNTQKGTYGNMGQGRHRTGNMNNMHYANEGAKRGLYDQANAYEKDRGNNQQYQRNNHYDGREHAGQQNLANDYGEAARYQEERYVDRPPYGYPHPPYSGAYHTPPVGKRRITIYEDPRYIEPSRPYRRPSRYADDYLELDVRPVARHYVGRRLPPPPLPPRGYY